MSLMKENMNSIPDDLLENVSGGVKGAGYNNATLQRAGVGIKTVNGQTVYTATFSDGKTVRINENVAKGMCDCYKISGGTKLTDQQLMDLIRQS